MKKIIAMMVCVVLLVGCVNVVFAERLATAVKTSSGGTMGSTTGAGYMNVTNPLEAGKDTTTASTSSNARGTLTVKAYITYTDGSGSREISNSKSASGVTNVQTSKKVPAGTHGSQSRSEHSYYSAEYGSWSDSLKKTY